MSCTCLSIIRVAAYAREVACQKKRAQKAGPFGHVFLLEALCWSLSESSAQSPQIGQVQEPSSAAWGLAWHTSLCPRSSRFGSCPAWETSSRLPASSKEAPPCAAASGTSCQDCAGEPGDSLPEQIRSDVADSHPGYSPILPAEVSRPGHPSLPRRSRKPIWASPRPAGPSAASATMTDRRPASSSSMLTVWHT